MTTSFTPRYVIVARHGERLDYIRRDAGNPWTPTAARPYDPPLTEHGQEQARRLGQHLRQELENRGIPPIQQIYTSPFLRCRQTAVGAASGLATSDDCNDNFDTHDPLPVRVEYGLSESFNESWFRSWALPGTDGTWGFRLEDGNDDLTTMDPELFHSWARHPVQELPLFSDYRKDKDVTSAVDATYASKTQLVRPFSLSPLLLETRQEQSNRMKSVVDISADGSNTIMLTSHGAPVQHLFAALTGQSWKQHGPSVYCCYSIYESTESGGWRAIAVNQSDYLHETLQGDNYIANGDEKNASTK